jgi:hypothetical protein
MDVVAGRANELIQPEQRCSVRLTALWRGAQEPRPICDRRSGSSPRYIVDAERTRSSAGPLLAHNAGEVVSACRWQCTVAAQHQRAGSRRRHYQPHMAMASTGCSTALDQATYRSVRIPAIVALPAHRAPLSHRAWRSAETGSRGRLKVR